MFDLKPISLNLPNADITYYPQFFSENDANSYYKTLIDTISWQQDVITIFGKTHLQPRLTALFATNNKTYSYSNLVMKPKPLTKELETIKKKVETFSGTTFTTCLANLYRNGNDSNGWHSDDEKELGVNPIIASVSFGAKRFFHLKHKNNKQLKYKIELEHGSLLLMKGETQRYWKHQIPKTKRLVNKRINLTFRVIL